MRRTNADANRQRAADKKKMIILGSLVGVLGVIWSVNFLKGPSQKAAGRPSVSATAVVQLVSEPVETRPVRMEVPVDWPASSRRNPFGFDDQAYQKEQVEAPMIKRDFQLQGTLLGKDPRAFINGKGYRIGESIDGAILKAIDHGQVILQVDGAEIVVGKQ